MEKTHPLKPVLNRTDHKCFGCAPVNPYGLKMAFFSDGRSVFHPDLVNASDAVIGKAGYNTLAEVFYAGTPSDI